MSKKMKLVLSVILIFVGFILLLIVSKMYLYRGSQKVSSSIEKDLKIDVVKYRQDDKEWADDTLGQSEYKMKSSGCLVTCIASALTMNGAEYTPKSMNELFSEKGVFDNDGNILWDNIASIEGFGVKVYDEVENRILDECLQDGKYPIVRVRVNGDGSFHYVLIVGTVDGEYVCMDPLKNDLMKLSEYKDRIYAIRCVWYE